MCERKRSEGENTMKRGGKEGGGGTAASCGQKRTSPLFRKRRDVGVFGVASGRGTGEGFKERGRKRKEESGRHFATEAGQLRLPAARRVRLNCRSRRSAS